MLKLSLGDFIYVAAFIILIMLYFLFPVFQLGNEEITLYNLNDYLVKFDTKASIILKVLPILLGVTVVLYFFRARFLSKFIGFFTVIANGAIIYAIIVLTGSVDQVQEFTIKMLGEGFKVTDYNYPYLIVVVLGCLALLLSSPKSRRN
jgi:hypothetical protein